METRSLYGFLILVIVLGSCSNSKEVVTNGPFQKRKYRSGWHVDLRSTKNHHVLAKKVEITAPDDQELELTENTGAVVPRDSFHGEPASRTGMKAEPGRIAQEQVERVILRPHKEAGEPIASTARTGLVRSIPGVKWITRTIDRHVAVPSTGAPEDGGNDRTNGMAIAGFVCSFLIPLLGLIFSAIALGQIKRNGGRGRGLAMAGLIISIVAMVIILASL